MRAPTSRLKRIVSYAEAKAFMDKTAPTRGENYVPLGDRRYHDQHNMRRVGEDYVVCAFGQDIIRYTHTADTLLINERGVYLDKALLDTIMQVLGLVCGNEHNGKFTVYTGKVPSESNKFRHRHVFYRRSRFTLATNEGGWYVPDPPVLYTHHLNRTAANNVRESVKEFREYMERMIKVRETVDVDMGLPNMGSSIGFTSYIFHVSEAIAALGENYVTWTRLINKPTTTESLVNPAIKSFYKVTLEGIDQTLTEWEFYERRAKQFMEMIRSGDYDQFYKAMLIVVLCSDRTQMSHMIYRTRGDAWFLGVPSILDALDEIILKANSRECFKLVQVPQGTVPSDQYEKYVFWPA